MNLGNRHRIQLLVIFLVTIIAIILLSASFWNQGAKHDVDFSIWPLIFLVIALMSSGLFFLYVVNITNPKILEEQLDEKVEQERAKILEQFKSREEEVINKNEDLTEMINKIIPQGKFKSVNSFSDKLLFQLTGEIQASLGILYLAKGKEFKYVAGFALPKDSEPGSFKAGENLNGQVAKTQEVLVINDIPEDYFSIESGLGKSKPETLIILPVIHKKNTIGIIEIATFIKEDPEKWTDLLGKVGQNAGDKIVQIQKSK